MVSEVLRPNSDDFCFLAIESNGLSFYQSKKGMITRNIAILIISLTMPWRALRNLGVLCGKMITKTPLRSQRLTPGTQRVSNFLTI